MGSKAYGAFSYETSEPIASFATLGSKNYSYVTESGETCVKSRGFTLTNTLAKSKLNHSVMKDLLLKKLDNVEDSVTVSSFGMDLCRKTLSISNVEKKKIYRNKVFDKRFIPPSSINSQLSVEERNRILTLPFGIVHLRFNDCK